MRCLCRLYKSVSEYDVVSAVLSRHVTTHPVTREAIDAEVHNDYVLAAKRYNQVFLVLSLSYCSHFIDVVPVVFTHSLKLTFFLANYLPHNYSI